jgi:hypothetical protein
LQFSRKLPHKPFVTPIMAQKNPWRSCRTKNGQGADPGGPTGFSEQT